MVNNLIQLTNQQFIYTILKIVIQVDQQEGK